MRRVFISYRRQDSGPLATALKNCITPYAGVDNVFLDTKDIQPGTPFPEVIQRAVESACVMFVVIGPRWLQAQDQYGRRLLDNPDDWVCREIIAAMQCDIRLVPIFVGGASFPPKSALPDHIADLTDYQAIPLEEKNWHKSLRPVIDVLCEECVAIRPIEQARLPKFTVKPPSIPKKLDARELQVYEDSNEPWKVVRTTEPQKQVELHREFEFPSFELAMNFMDEVAVFMSANNHHARWENLWKTVKVYLTTWNLDFNVSQLDVQLAQHMDAIYDKLKDGPASKEVWGPGWDK